MGPIERFFKKWLPSKIEELHDPLFDTRQVKVYIKRDDLLHPHISGNKWRKLKYLLMQAEAEDIKHVVSFGGAYSNHLPALAAACHELGFESTGFVRGEELSADSNAQLALCKKMGMNLLFVEREKYKNKRLLFNEHFGQNSKALFVDEGGHSPLGAKGCEAIIEELSAAYDHIFLPVGTGTTLAGMANAIRAKWLAGTPTTDKLPAAIVLPSPFGEGRVRPKLHGIVVLKGAEYLSEQIKELSPKSNCWQLHHQFHAGGFAKADEKLLQFIQVKQASWKIPLEPVYSGKMAHGFYTLLEEGFFKKAERVLLLHTGGI